MNNFAIAGESAAYTFDEDYIDHLEIGGICREIYCENIPDAPDFDPGEKLA